MWNNQLNHRIPDVGSPNANHQFIIGWGGFPWSTYLLHLTKLLIAAQMEKWQHLSRIRTPCPPTQTIVNQRITTLFPATLFEQAPSNINITLNKALAHPIPVRISHRPDIGALPRTCNLKSVINSDVSISCLPIPVRITQRDKNITTNQRGKPRHNCISIPRKTITNNNSNISSFKVMLPSFLLINVRSLLPKIDDLTALLSANPVDLVAITESWLHKDIEDSLLHILIWNH